MRSFEDTQKIIIGPSSLTKVMIALFSMLISIVMWLGSSLINKVEDLSINFNAYAIRMEGRVAALEEAIKRSNQR